MTIIGFSEPVKSERFYTFICGNPYRVCCLHFFSAKCSSPSHDTDRHSNPVAHCHCWCCSTCMSIWVPGSQDPTELMPALADVAIFIAEVWERQKDHSDFRGRKICHSDHSSSLEAMQYQKKPKRGETNCCPIPNYFASIKHGFLFVFLFFKVFLRKLKWNCLISQVAMTHHKETQPSSTRISQWQYRSQGRSLSAHCCLYRTGKGEEGPHQATFLETYIPC